MTTLETRFDTILPTLATKEDVKKLEARFEATLPTLATKDDLNETKQEIKDVEIRLVRTIHQEINRHTWHIITWMTTVLGLGFAGVYYIARHVHP